MKNVSPLNLEEPCVLVLGAGASAPYGFPTGADLKQKILGHLDPARRRVLNESNFPNELINEFHEVLKYSSISTIDAFLGKMEKYREIGAYSIALTIMPLEIHDNLFPKKDWYGYLFDTLRLEDESTQTSNLSIVTLNYDRSLEYFLEKSIRYECAERARNLATKKCNEIKIVHAHGSFGKYPETPYGLNLRKPTPNVDEHGRILSATKIAAEGIKIISDKLDDSEDYKAAQKIISQAKSVIFLGFGHHESVLSNLLSKSNVKDQRYYSTSLNLANEVVENTKKYFESRDSKIVMANQDCRGFLPVLKQICERGSNLDFHSPIRPQQS